MNIKNALVGLALLVFVGGGGFLAYNHFVPAGQQCDICGRAVHMEHESTIVLKDGVKVHACCPRCALHYELHQPGKVVRLLVEDRTTAKRIDARNAFYVEGSDDAACLQASDALPREPGVDYSRTFDRCLPSLVAFSEESAARQFIAAHGGRLLTYEQTVASVKQR